MLRRAAFVLGVLPGRYDGWTRGETWNGFACPLFDEATTRSVVRDLNASGDGRASLDEGTGVVSVLDDDYPGEPERFGPEVVEVEGRPVRLWAIGAMVWAWREAISLSAN